MPNRNSKVLESFVAYCTEHPEERFWQALRNFCGHNFVWVSNRLPVDEEAREMEWLRDTFYWEGRDG